MKTTATLVRALVAGPRCVLAAFLRAKPMRGFLAPKRPAAAACLPAALASVLLGVLPAPGAAQAEPDVRAQIERAARTSLVILELADGQTVSGSFHGFVGDWRDTVNVAVRYEAWRTAHAEGAPRLGEPLIVFLATGDTLRGGFKGVGPSFLVLGSGNSRFDVPANVGEITEVRSDDGVALAPWTELRGRMLDAPSYIGVGLKRGPQTILVSREAILAARGEGKRAGKNELLIVLSVIAGGLLVCAAVGAVTGGSRNNQNDDREELQKILEDCFGISCSRQATSRPTSDGRFGTSDVTHGLEPWAPGETRRP